MEFRDQAFTERELEISTYLTAQKTVPEIAQLTGLTRKLVRAHLRNMMEKLHVHSLAGLRRVLMRL